MENLSILNFKELNSYKIFLLQKKEELIKNTQNIDTILKKIKNTLSIKCEEEFKEHSWIKEKEDCIYGETYIYCSRCGKDKFSYAIYN